MAGKTAPPIIGPVDYVKFRVGTKSAFKLHVYDVYDPVLRLKNPLANYTITPGEYGNGTFVFEWTPADTTEVTLE